jgi:KUP system potassium uptake protein
VVLKVPVKVPGHAVFMVQNPDVTPPALIQNIKHNKLVHKHIVFLTVMTEKIPHIRRQDQIAVTPMRQGVDRIVARCGFMDTPDIPQMLKECSKQGVDIPIAQTTFFLSRVTYLATPRPGMQIWREKIFVFLSRNSQRASSFFRIPSDQVIEIGLVLEI